MRPKESASLPRLRASHSMDRTRSLPQSKQSETQELQKSPRRPQLDALISSCRKLRGTLGPSMSRFLFSLKKKQRLLLRVHRTIQLRQGSWRNQPQYSLKRDDIREALSDRNTQVKEKEAQMLQYIIGLSDSPKSSFSLGTADGLSYKDLMSSRMSQLLSLNKRDFGQTYSGTPLRLAEATPKPMKKVSRARLSSDDAMLKREIFRFKRQDLKLVTQSIPPPAVLVGRERTVSAALDEEQLGAMSSLNRFIFKQQQRFQPKTLVKTKSFPCARVD